MEIFSQSTPTTPATSTISASSTTSANPITSSASSVVANSASTTSAQREPNTINLYDLTPQKLPTTTTGSLASLFFQTYAPKDTLTVSLDEKNRAIVKTEDGYQVQFSGKNEEWFIIRPDGKKTRIWGDPHVVESDGDKWDFTDQSTFYFGNNKVTVEVTPYGNGETLTKTVTIYNGNSRVTISDINKNQPKLEAWTWDAEAHDKDLDDGDHYGLALEDGKETWKTLRK